LVRIAIRNLAHNAVRHGRGPAGAATITLVVADGLVMIEDTGPGVPDSTEHGRQRFGAHADDGVGLGLAIARWVAELHGGMLRLARSAGGGTSAVLTLPEPQPRSATARPEKARLLKARPEKARLLKAGAEEARLLKAGAEEARLLKAGAEEARLLKAGAERARLLKARLAWLRLWRRSGR
jgi:hypothetical protein